jgi:RNA polymerase sigma-70 factor (ECF subfamily)
MQARTVMADSAGHPPRGRPDAGDERTLLERMRRGDRAAFAGLIDRHAGSLLRVARSLVRDGAVAEELVQETWIALLTGLDRFEGRSSLRTWLIGVLVNKARTRLARERRTVPFSFLEDAEGRASPATEPADPAEYGGWVDPPGAWTESDPERLAMGTETREVIEAAIRELPDAQRAVVTLRDIEGLETDEICNLLGVTVTNQRVLLHRARARLRRALEERLGRRR